MKDNVQEMEVLKKYAMWQMINHQAHFHNTNTTCVGCGNGCSGCGSCSSCSGGPQIYYFSQTCKACSNPGCGGCKGCGGA